MSIRVLLADDHGVLRDAMTRLLASEGDFEVVGTANDGSATAALFGAASGFAGARCRPALPRGLWRSVRSPFVKYL